MGGGGREKLYIYVKVWFGSKGLFTRSESCIESKKRSKNK